MSRKENKLPSCLSHYDELDRILTNTVCKLLNKMIMWQPWHRYCCHSLLPISILIINLHLRPVTQPRGCTAPCQAEPGPPRPCPSHHRGPREEPSEDPVSPSSSFPPRSTHSIQEPQKACFGTPPGETLLRGEGSRGRGSMQQSPYLKLPHSWPGGCREERRENRSATRWPGERAALLHRPGLEMAF